MTMIKTKLGTFTLAGLLILSGFLMDASGSMVAQALHHLMFILSGMAIATGLRK
jgi:hypothetical protein